MEKAGVAREVEREPVVVPREWRERGYSGRYHQRVRVPPDVAAHLVAAGPPCWAPRDRAWLVLAVEWDDPEGDGVVTLVRLDAMALLDLSARRPSPGAYRGPA